MQEVTLQLRKINRTADLTVDLSKMFSNNKKEIQDRANLACRGTIYFD